MKMRWCILVAVLFTAYAAMGHVGDRIYPFFELTDEQLAEIDLYDGSAEDWETLVGEPSLTLLDFSIGSSIGVQYNPLDFDFRIWLGWNDSTNRIYIALEEADDLYVNQYDLSGLASFMTYHDSSIDLLIDGDHSGGQFQSGSTADASYLLGETLEERRQLVYQQAQEYVAIAEVPRGSHVQLGSRDFVGWYTSPPYADGGGTSFGESPVVSVTEFYMTPFDHLVRDNPEESIVSELFPGKIIGFQITLVDIDEEDRFKGNTFTPVIDTAYSLPGGGLYVFFADYFVDGLLVGTGEETVVRDVTWARIKASFAR